MKGILFCEFVEYLEAEFGEDQAQDIIEKSKLESEGAFSRVGFYDYQELISLLTMTAHETDNEATDLLQGYANHLFGVFKRDYGVFFKGKSSAVEMLKTVDDHIHVEVKKLYPDAELPSFAFEEQGEKIKLKYHSPRPLASVAYALVNACLHSFGDTQKLLSYEISEDQKSAYFEIA